MIQLKLLFHTDDTNYKRVLTKLYFKIIVLAKPINKKNKTKFPTIKPLVCEITRLNASKSVKYSAHFP
ncbi:hypothetical protein BpHYR1_019761 [Brachionus plicatilis]|uniref:Uncharacterized protein n=1 Tax=Brachionus plicatilis TaxID=10195 RepID=A0A3M7PPQ7_BRAPC|nr:hypothetical protein BpHYR1_019761 [Brachionus plicatilis]